MDTQFNTFAAGDGGHAAWLRANVKDNRPLHPRNEEVGSFTADVGLHSSKPVEDDGSLASVN